MTEANVLKRYIGRAGQLRYKVAPWMLDRQVAHIPVGLAISWLVFLWPLDLSSGALHLKSVPSKTFSSTMCSLREKPIRLSCMKSDGDVAAVSDNAVNSPPV